MLFWVGSFPRVLPRSLSYILKRVDKIQKKYDYISPKKHNHSKQRQRKSQTFMAGVRGFFNERDV